MSRGFDSFYGFYNGMISYWNKTFLNYVDLQTGHSIVTDEKELSEDMHTTYLFQNKVEEAIADHAENYADQPMFMYYATQLIHGPWSAPSVFMKRCADPRLKIDDVDAAADLRNYCALNVMLDEVVTNLTCALNAHGMGDNTMLIIVSDNGGDSNVKYSGNSYPFKGNYQPINHLIHQPRINHTDGANPSCYPSHTLSLTLINVTISFFNDPLWS